MFTNWSVNGRMQMGNSADTVTEPMDLISTVPGRERVACAPNASEVLKANHSSSARNFDTIRDV
jgi:hypothetical protein